MTLVGGELGTIVATKNFVLDRKIIAIDNVLIPRKKNLFLTPKKKHLSKTELEGHEKGSLHRQESSDPQVTYRGKQTTISSHTLFCVKEFQALFICLRMAVNG